MTDTFLKVWKLLTATYPNAPQSTNRETMAIYARTLSDLPVEALEAATISALSSCKWFPTIAELRELAFAAIERDSDLPTPSEAWGTVCDAIRAVGYYRTPTWKHAAIEQAVRAVGGWQTLCLSENEVADRKQFIDAYTAIVMRARADARQLPEVREAIQRLKANNRQQQVAGLIGGAVKKLERDR